MLPVTIGNSRVRLMGESSLILCAEDEDCFVSKVLAKETPIFIKRASAASSLSIKCSYTEVAKGKTRQPQHLAKSVLPDIGSTITKSILGPLWQRSLC